MKSKLDKNSKLTSGQSKEANSSETAKSKSAKPSASSAPEKSKGKDKPLSPKASETKSAKPIKAVEEANVSKGFKARPAVPKAESKPVSAREAVAKSASDGPIAKAPAGKSAKASSETELTLEEFSISLIKPGETRERVWRTKSFQQHPAQREFGFPDTAPELPGSYSEPKLVLMPKDPEYMFCYWELTPTLLGEKEKEKMPAGNYRETLKINWESRSLFEPKCA